MPWCEDCAKYFAPSSMTESGACPSCGRQLERQQVTSRNIDLKRLAAGENPDTDDVSAPWHFKLLMVLLAVYLGWRVVDLFL